MSDYTIQYMMEIDDMAAGRATGMEARFARSHIDSEHLGISHFRQEPGVRSPFGHSHREQEEVYVVVSGSEPASGLGDEINDLRAWDLVRVAPHVVRAFEAGPDGLELIAVGNDRPEGGDGELVEDWWTD